MRTETFYAAGMNTKGQIAQILVTREVPELSDPHGVGSRRQEWTGVVYASGREAKADVLRLNASK